MLFKKFKESNRQPNKVCVDKGNEFYNKSMKSFFLNNNIEMCSEYNEVYLVSISL